ncbi:MAG: hypothetical protein LW688_00750 [Cryomorphaceae bacterium]|nr:hypothetical protein [Cryomorphaceae bacterium]
MERVIFFIFLVLVLVSCKTSKKAMDNPTNTDLLKGVVHTGGDCGVYLSLLIEGQEQKAFPANLPEEFKKDGLKIKFLSSPSRAPQPAGCIVDKVISVEQVEVLK